MKWVKHLGCIGTCRKLKIALETLEQIAALPRAGRGGRLAGATIAFLKYT